MATNLGASYTGFFFHNKKKLVRDESNAVC